MTNRKRPATAGPGVPEAPAPFTRDGEEARLKVRRIGNSLGVVLPRDVLARLGVGEGDMLAVSETEAGVVLSARDDATQRQVAVARDLMGRYRYALRKLAQ